LRLIWNVRLIPRRPSRLTGLVAVRDTEAAVELLGALRDRVPSLVACELFFPEGMELVSSHRQAEPPFRIDSGAYVLLECASDGPPLDELAAGLAHAPPLAHEAFAEDSAGRARLWLFREAHNEALNAAGVPHKFDVTLPLDRLAAFEAELRRAVRARTVIYGHLGDGNLHVNVLDPPPGIDALVLELVAAHAGSVSAEHGVGQSRRAFVHLGRSDADIAAMRAIKRALDPRGTLNPGKVLPPE
jgi:FAD/FMN-containing dehydrogenase